MIPHVFHRIWLGGKELPEHFKKWGETWLERHPTWTMKLWREKEVSTLRNSSLLAKCSSYPQQADVCRYEILYREGGVYLDTDMECLRNIEALIKDVDLFCCWQKEGIVSNAIFGCSSKHKTMKTIYKKCKDELAPEPWNAMGPPYFTKYISQDQTAKIFDRKTFIPYTWAEYKEFPRHPMPIPDPPPESYAINHRANIWYQDSRKYLLEEGKVL